MSAVIPAIIFFFLTNIISASDLSCLLPVPQIHTSPSLCPHLPYTFLTCTVFIALSLLPLCFIPMLFPYIMILYLYPLKLLAILSHCLASKSLLLFIFLISQHYGFIFHYVNSYLKFALCICFIITFPILIC